LLHKRCRRRGSVEAIRHRCSFAMSRAVESRVAAPRAPRRRL
jgi:hypothetical protein